MWYQLDPVPQSPSLWSMSIYGMGRNASSVATASCIQRLYPFLAGPQFGAT
jgi:hypothetical protein